MCARTFGSASNSAANIRTSVLLWRMPSIRAGRRSNVSYYARHREEEIARVRCRQASTLQFLRAVRAVPCTECGGRFAPWQLDFDHRDPATKSFALTSGRALLRSRAEIVAELAKCDIVCGNATAFGRGGSIVIGWPRADRSARGLELRNAERNGALRPPFSTSFAAHRALTAARRFRRARWSSTIGIPAQSSPA
jgi:hypothetical protein